jgi:hypothetical protein
MVPSLKKLKKMTGSNFQTKIRKETLITNVCVATKPQEFLRATERSILAKFD